MRALSRAIIFTFMCKIFSCYNFLSTPSNTPSLFHRFILCAYYITFHIFLAAPSTCFHFQYASVFYFRFPFSMASCLLSFPDLFLFPKSLVNTFFCLWRQHSLKKSQIPQSFFKLNSAKLKLNNVSYLTFGRGFGRGAKLF
jgi:hypothetical protein